MVKRELSLRQRVDYGVDGVEFDEVGGYSPFNNDVVSGAYFDVMGSVGDLILVTIARSVGGLPSRFSSSAFTAIDNSIENALGHKEVLDSIKQSARRSLWRT